ncbi:MAG: CxxC-x17-CxxC domain-containing protein [Dehalococcoidia bacterium]
MNFTDKTLTCVDCGTDFIFSVDDQAFHQEKGFTNEPRRCASCRASRRAERNGGGGSSYSSGGGSYGGGSGGYGGSREMYSATCASCGKEARVPFQPRGDKPVYCSDCFRSQRGSTGGSSYSSGGGGYGSRGSRY